MSSENGHNLQVVRMNHSDKLARAVEGMFSDETLCDVTICCRGQSVKAHRVILAATSLYFKELFAHTPPGQYPIVFVSSIPISDLNAILEYIYKGEVTIPQTQIESLVRSADTLGIIGLGNVSLENQELWKNLNSQAKVKPSEVNNCTNTPNADDVNDSPDSASGESVKSASSTKETNKSTSSIISASSKRGRKRKSTTETSKANIFATNTNAQPVDSIQIEHNSNSVVAVSTPNPVNHIGSCTNDATSSSTIISKECNLADKVPNMEQQSDLKCLSLSSDNQLSSNGHMPVTPKCDHPTANVTGSNENNSSSSATNNFGKITKSKLRSWSQQITQKNLAATLSKFGPSTLHINSAPSASNLLVEQNSLKLRKVEMNDSNEISLSSPSNSSCFTYSTPIGIAETNPDIKLEARPRGRPRKIMIPQLNPIPINNDIPKVNGTAVTSVNGLVNLKDIKTDDNDNNCAEENMLLQADDSDTPLTTKRGRGRPPNHSKLVSKPNSHLMEQPQQPKPVMSPVPQVAL